MPKMKTKKTLSKRVKKTGTGKLKRSHNYISHMAAHKSHKQKVHLRKSTLVSSSDMKRIKHLIQY